MRHFLIPLSVAVLTLPLSLSLSARADTNWLPLEEGNAWTFEARGTTGPAQVSVDVSWGPLHSVNGLTDEGNWLLDMGWFTGDVGDVYIWNDTTACWDLFLPADSDTRPFVVDLSSQACDTFEVELLPERETYDTPAGRFHEARTYRWTLQPEPNVRCRAPLLSEVVFGAEVGPVRFTDGDGYSALLTEAVVGSRVISPNPSTEVVWGDLATRAQLDANLYVNEHNTIYCVRAPCPSNRHDATMNVWIVLRNDGNENVELTMPTGQWFDAQIVDLDGRVVRRWSDDKMFTQATRTIVIRPGQTYDGLAAMELTDAAGDQLEGRYTVEAWIVGSDALADVDFDVDVVPSRREPDLDQSK